MRARLHYGKAQMHVDRRREREREKSTKKILHFYLVLINDLTQLGSSYTTNYMVLNIIVVAHLSAFKLFYIIRLMCGDALPVTIDMSAARERYTLAAHIAHMPQATQTKLNIGISADWQRANQRTNANRRVRFVVRSQNINFRSARSSSFSLSLSISRARPYRIWVFSKRDRNRFYYSICCAQLINNNNRTICSCSWRACVCVSSVVHVQCALICTY